VFKKPGTQPFRGVRGCHRHVEPNHRMCPAAVNDVRDGGIPEQFGPFSRIGVEGGHVGTFQPRQIPLEVGLQGGDQQGLAKTAGSDKKRVLRLQSGTVAVDRGQQSAQVAGLVDVQAAAPSNGDELRLVRVQKGQVHER